MKVYIFLFLLVAPIFGSAQISKQQEIEKLVVLLQIKPTMKNMVSTGIELYKKKKPAVPQQIWEQIKSSVDYTPYISKVTGILSYSYSQPEIKHLIVLVQNAKPGKQPKFKPEVKQALYRAGNDFGRQLGQFVAEQLRQNGY